MDRLFVVGFPTGFYLGICRYWVCWCEIKYYILKKINMVFCTISKCGVKYCIVISKVKKWPCINTHKQGNK